MTKTERLYEIWFKGRRLSTTQTIRASALPCAIWKAARALECKSIDLDGRWVREASTNARAV